MSTRVAWGSLLSLFLSTWMGCIAAGATKPCVTPDEAAKHLNKDICISAHIYDVVDVSRGDSYLDVCAPGTPDEQCRFTFLSFRRDRNEVGDLHRFRNSDVEVRGLLQEMHGRSAMIISHARQFHGGPPKFRPNPRLARGFDAEDDRTPISDANLRSHGAPRSFMNRNDREALLH